MMANVFCSSLKVDLARAHRIKLEIRANAKLLQQRSQKIRVMAAVDYKALHPALTKCPDHVREFI